ncbi:UvrB/UvrC motif-containing protein, partial [Sulfobacillus acidophilus]|nr:UvrB/UvrC motif-containing protein [Sulfobacillus acidophilus]
IRISFFGDEVESIQVVDPLRGQILSKLTFVTLFPASHYATSKERVKRAREAIFAELKLQLNFLNKENLLLEAQRLEQRCNFDLEMLELMGSCKGIENYSRHLTGRQTGEPPPTLLDYFPRDFLMFIDESHQTVSQVGAMYRGDRARKETLVSHGFRLPSALDNRPLQFKEFEEHINQVIYVSATPRDYEINKSLGFMAEQLIRPTGLLDPVVELKPAQGQVDDVIGEARKRKDLGERVLITTLTKRMAEDLADYLMDVGIKTRYLHSDIDTLERVEILRQLRAGEFDVLVGINLLREGLDLPEVSLVAILDADKEGFLRSSTCLIQTIGRAARNKNGKAILYGDRITDSMRLAINETKRRRKTQEEYNKKHHIEPKTIQKAILQLDEEFLTDKKDKKSILKGKKGLSPEKLEKEIAQLKSNMLRAAKKMDFEKAAEHRDDMHKLQEYLMAIQT